MWEFFVNIFLDLNLNVFKIEKKCCSKSGKMLTILEAFQCLRNQKNRVKRLAYRISIHVYLDNDTTKFLEICIWKCIFYCPENRGWNKFKCILVFSFSIDLLSSEKFRIKSYRPIEKNITNTIDSFVHFTLNHTKNWLVFGLLLIKQLNYCYLAHLNKTHDFILVSWILK